MTNEKLLSDDGVQRRQRILQAAIEEGGRLRKRRRAVRRAGVGTVVGLVIVAILTVNSIQTEMETNHDVVSHDQGIVVPDSRPMDGAYIPVRVEMVSSNSVSVEEYIVRTADISPSVIMLDDKGLIDALKDVNSGIVRAGGRVWLTRSDVSMVQIN